MRAPAVILLALVAGCFGDAGADSGLKILRIPMSTDGPKTLDPVRGSTVYEARSCEMVYETLLQYKYLVRPPTLEPLLLAEMPAVSEDGRTYTFRLKTGIRFRDDPCFPDGKGREVEARDVIFSWKRMADDANDPKSWWLFKGTIVGFDKYREEQNAAERFDYDAPVEGLRVLDRQTLQVELIEPVHRFLYVLAMFQTAVVAREAVETYGTRFSLHPVGTGPFLLREESDWVMGMSMVLHRNPEYRDARYPSEGSAEDKANGLLKAAGKRIPFVDRVEFTFFVEAQPQWLEFRAGHLEYTTVPAENFNEAFVKRTRSL
ncbi:MAG: ABC transporter substrate-binding protein, partial [Planctomycetota bacterium]